jgi:hypothetical protein
MESTRSLSFGLESLGAEVTYVDFPLEVGQTVTIDFAEYGIPKGATILSVDWCSMNGNCMPAELVPGAASVNYKYMVTEVVGVLSRIASPPESSVVQARITWIFESNPTPDWLHLRDGFRAYSQERYREFIIASSSVVEVSCFRLLSVVLEKTLGKDKLSRFLRDITFSTAMNVIVPIISSYERFPLLPDHIRGLLNRLRSLRNEVIHEGTLSAMTTRETQELLCATCFGHQYFALLTRGDTA